MSGATLQIRERPGGLVFAIRVQPKGGRDELIGLRDGQLWLKVTAPPVGGQANKACIKLLAETLGIPQSQMALTGGVRSRQKMVQVSGVTADALLAAVAGALESPGGA